MRFSRRMRRTAGGVAGAALLAQLASCSGHPLPPPSTDIDDTGLREAVRILASDEFEGRRPGTPGQDKTVAYLVAEFRRLKLKPGYGESYLQQVPLVELRAAGDASLSVSGRGLPRPLENGRNMVIWSPREASEAVVQRSELVFVGYGIVAPDYGWNDYAGVDVRDKTVIVLAGDPGTPGADPKFFRGGAGSVFGRSDYKFEEAARQGAAAVLLIHEDRAAGYPWAVVVNEGTGPHLQAPSADGNARRAAIEGWLSTDAARGLFIQAGVDFSAVTGAASRPGFKPLALGLKADAVVHNAVRRFTSPNVVAILPGNGNGNGNGRGRGAVLYVAHWDHLGRQDGAAGGGIFNGAVDDASGVAGLLTLAQSFTRTQPPPVRSIVFIAFTAGDAGLLGSDYYAANPVIPLRQTAGVLNLDRLHVGGPSRDLVIFGAGNSEMDDLLREAALMQGREVHPDPDPHLEQGAFLTSDSFTFARAGVPVLYATAGPDDSARGPAWGRMQSDDYRQHRFHQTGDKYSPDWDLRGAEDDLRLYYEVGNRLARSRRFPRWYPDSEFRGHHAPRESTPAAPEN